MAWRLATGRHACNGCRTALPAGEEAWRGDVAPAWWCKTCAASLPGTSSAPAAVAPVSLVEALEALRLRAEQAEQPVERSRTGE